MSSLALKKTAIIVFCLWHMTAIAFYAMPANFPSVVLREIRGYTLPLVTPYLHLTSQWQVWNLFSPNPYRKVTSYVIQANPQNKGWRTIKVIDWSTLPFWKRADELKLLRMIEDGGDTWTPIAQRYLKDYCTHMPIGSQVRMQYRSYILPPLTVSPGPLWWHTMKPEAYEQPGAVLRCPSPVAQK